MKKLLELRQQKATFTEQMRSLLTKAEDEKRSLNADEAKQFDELRSQFEALNAEIARYEALSDEERNQAKTQPTSEKLSNDELRHYILTGETRTLSTGVPSEGGYTVIPELNKQIMQQLTCESVMRQICAIKITRSNEYKQLVSVGGAAVAHGEEGKVRGETTTPNDLKFLLRNKYRKNAVWVMNSTTAANVQKLKNGNGDYIWRERLQAGDPDMLLGLPVHYLEFMPDNIIGLGDFKRGYFIVDHETGTRTRPYNITEPRFYKVHTDKYLGGGLVDSNAIKVLEIKGTKAG
ncbi:phage major capsid protein [Xenorhabdus sp. XENO-10]|uniref:Phage major capsid protein n=1 Tax=Xenorhabdus yunnanensis TaxID=3025878 RepID=A0ABT5LNN8_9GAMM|nr:phage major capsid protein [Xenorhabdus yunnanensis]MDC9591390.1 phage major capsid protein [Xenorhabdus yunnanensis]